MNCRYCHSVCIKKGKQNGQQKLFCKKCNKYQQSNYVRRVLNSVRQLALEFLHGEGCSVSTIGRALKFSKTTICRWIARTEEIFRYEVEMKPNREYQADELRTFVGNKENECWIMYSINKSTSDIVSWCVGRRTKENLEKVTSELVRHHPKSICTDGLPMYGTLIPEEIHEVRKTKTNKIERRNSQLRLQLKRLNRKTICFSRSERMLRCSFVLYLKYVVTGSENYELVL